MLSPWSAPVGVLGTPGTRSVPRRPAMGEEVSRFFVRSIAQGFAGVRVRLNVTVRDRQGRITGGHTCEHDMTLLQSAQFFVSNQLGVASGLSFKDTSGSSHAQTAQVLAGTPQIEFGTNSTAANWSDFAIGTAAGGTNPVTATVSAITPASTQGTFTVTGMWTNSTGVTVTITELALYVTTTAGMASNSTFALTHDVFTGQAVSNGGTAAATLTYTWS